MANRPYHQVAAEMRRRIQTGEWAPQQMIPGRKRLADDFGVALTTLERAVATLITEGLLRVDDRRGTFVHAEPMGIVPNHPAIPSGPLRATIGLLAAVIPYGRPAEFEAQWPVNILRACEDSLASQEGITCHFSNAIEHAGLSWGERSLQQLLEAKPDLAILIAPRNTEELLSRLHPVPTVVIHYDPQPVLAPQVYIDGGIGGALAAKHLLAAGWKDLVFFQPFAAEWSTVRLHGVQTALRRHADLKPLRLVPNDPPPQTSSQYDMALQAARTFLEASPGPCSGIIAANDAIAEGFLDAAAERGLRAGQNFGIVGFDDRVREAGLSSLRPPLENLGAEGAALALRLLRKETAPVRIALQHKLIPRTSSRFPTTR